VYLTFRLKQQKGSGMKNDEGNRHELMSERFKLIKNNKREGKMKVNKRKIIAKHFEMVNPHVCCIERKDMNTQTKNLKGSFMTKLNQILGVLLLALTLCSGIAIADPFMHVHDSSGNLAIVDVATGSVNLIGNMGAVMTDIAFDPTGNLYGITFTALYSINPTTAEVIFIGNHSVPSGNALVFGSDGTLYGAGNLSTGLFSINTLTGASTLLGNMGFASAGDLAFYDGNLFYLASNGNEFVSIDLDNLSNTSVAGDFGISNVYGLATGDDGILYCVADTTIYTVDTTTGAATNGVSFAGQGLGEAYGQSFYTEAFPCGDGILDEEEECDDGNKIDGDGCSGICLNEDDEGGMPPVKQNLGFDDKPFNDMTVDECLSCHQYFGSNPDRHHMLYGSAMPEGVCSATTDPEPRDCYQDIDCQLTETICSNSGDPCTEDIDCPRQYQHPECTDSPYCAGTSAAAKISGSQDNGGVYGCLTCHEESTSGGVTNFLVERDCTVCHEQLPNSPTVHHLDEDQNLAKAGKCVVCHGNIVDDMDDGHAIPIYTPGMITPEPVTTVMVCDDTGYAPAIECLDPVVDCPTGAAASCVPDKADVAALGGCNFCHDAGTDADSGIEVVDNHDTHHGTGVYKDRYGNTADLGGGAVACDWCHYQGNPHNDGGYDAISIRTCEGCHGMESLHSIQADSDESGDITVGGELYGYGHVGIDDPTGDSDCMGCHGKGYVSSMYFPGSGIIVPTIAGSAAINTIVANTDSQITITGNAFTNDAYTSVIELTPALGGEVIVITPSAISVDSITATINVPVGTYKLVADKSGVESNPVVLISSPTVGITISSIKTSCGDCEGTVTIEGSGFGAEIPAGVQSFMNVIQDGMELAIVSWTDTKIVATGGNCDGGAVTVNGLFGSTTK
jgi:cysteine-rich repeat protein